MNSLYNVFNQLLYCTPWNCYYSNQSWILKWKRYHRVSFWTWVYWITFYTEILLYLGQTFQTHRTTHIVVSSIFVSNNLHGFSKPPVSKIWILLKFVFYQYNILLHFRMNIKFCGSTHHQNPWKWVYSTNIGEKQ